MVSSDDWLAGGQRRELAVRAIRRAAREVLLERGVERFSVERVAARAGCSRATLYRVAGGKKALLDAVFAEEAAAVAGRISAAVDGLAGEERVVKAILVALREIRSDASTLAWVRNALLTGDYVQSSADLKGLAVTLTGSEAAAPYSGEWIMRVVLSLLVWPVKDETVESEIVRSFVAPGFR
ncbi:MAG TPA: helix-turn-helix domain-containing protein [Nocardioidaceae bacterium]|nr:helix-turn-helix domain-containing protein [Nocardioidaceae bacterium]